MPYDRANLKQAPGTVAYNGVTYYTRDPVIQSLDHETFEYMTEMFGPQDEATLDAMFRITFTPVSNPAYWASLWPYGATAQGASLFTATDKPIVVHGIDGSVKTYQAGAIIGPPEVTLAAGVEMFGSVTMLGIVKNNTARSAADSLVAETTSAFADTSFDPADLVKESWAAAWGASPFDSFRTQDGWRLTPTLNSFPVPTDEAGVIDHRFGGFKVMARCIPLVNSETADMTRLVVQGTGAARGRRIGAGASDLILTGAEAGLTFTLNLAALKTTIKRHGVQVLRQGEMAWVNTREFAAGVASPVFTIA